jgi:hypothetical protein
MFVELMEDIYHWDGNYADWSMDDVLAFPHPDFCSSSRELQYRLHTDKVNSPAHHVRHISGTTVSILT